MFVLIEIEPEEFGSDIACDLMGAYKTFDEAHDAMVSRMKEAEKRDHWCGLDTEDNGEDGSLYDENYNYLMYWQIFEVKE